jgi:predicted nucleic acid-binding protein
MTFIDTNVVLRWLLRDHPTLSAKARDLVQTAEDKPEELYITDVVLGEIFYVMKNKGYENRQTADILYGLLEQPAFMFDQESRLNLLIDIIRETTLDFADCYLISRAVFSKEPLETFDKPMLKAYNRYKTAS